MVSLIAVARSHSTAAITLKVGNQLLVMFASSASNTNSFNVLTDNSGTAVAGTAIDGVTTGSSVNPTLASVSSSAMYFYVARSSSEASLLKLTASGNSPVITVLDTAAIAASFYNVPNSNIGSRPTYEFPSNLSIGSKVSGNFITRTSLTALAVVDEKFALIDVVKSSVYNVNKSESNSLMWGLLAMHEIYGAAPTHWIVQRLRAL